VPASRREDSSLLQRYGKKWAYSLAIIDLYFDGMVPDLTAAGTKPTGQLFNISAGQYFGLSTGSF